MLARSCFLAFPFLAFGLTALGLTVLGPSALGQTVTVPDDAPDLSSAIALGGPGSTIQLDTTVLQAPVTLSFPVTILGAPGSRIGTEGLSGTFTGMSAVTLNGPGSGQVVLAGVELLATSDCALCAPLLAGTGFDSVELYDCVLAQPQTGFSGLGRNASTIDLDVPYLHLEGSTVIGQGDGFDDCTVGVPMDLRTYPAVHVPNGTVVAVASEIQGGSVAGAACCSWCSCFDIDLSDYASGGAGVVADQLHAFDSTIQGGAGVSVSTLEPWFQDCGQTATGAPVEAGLLVQGSGTLIAAPTAVVGGTWTLDYTAIAPSYLLVGQWATQPLNVPPYGYLYLEQPLLLTLGPLAAGFGQSLDLDVPALPFLVGMRFGFQILLPQIDILPGPVLSHPVGFVVVP